MIQEQDNVIRLNRSRRPASPSALEGMARAALSSASGRVLTDPEWARARYNLLQFADLLWCWERAKAAQTESRGPELQRKAA
jgi:hypothetical protein